MYSYTAVSIKEALTKLIAELPVADMWFYGERLDEIAFDWATTVIDASAWQHGVIFNQQAELAWWQQDKKFAVRWLASQKPPTVEGVVWSEGETVDVVQENWTRSATRLHGVNDGTTTDWAEARIPKRLLYPIIATSTLPAYVTLHMQTYRRSDGSTLTRLVTVEGPQVPGVEESDHGG